MTIVQIPGMETVWKREISPRDEVDTYVYIMAHLDDRYTVSAPVKVGISNNPWARMASLQTGSSSRIILLGSYCFWRRAHALEVERVFHHTAQVYRTGGEWFDIQPDSAVALMADNIRSFVKTVLCPDSTEDLYFAMEHIGLPGFAYESHEQNFEYRR